jgi:lantibiotic modifying enzyme
VQIAKLELLNYFNLSTPPENAADLPFIAAVWPYIETATSLTQDTSAYFTNAARNDLERALLSQWCDLVKPAIETEIAIENLNGTFTHEADFIERRFLEKEAARSFFEEYHTLSSSLLRSAQFWAHNLNALCVHLQNDLNELQTLFNDGKHLGKVVSVNAEASDSHHEGKKVHILHFESGRTILYKPKTIAMTLSFHTLCKDLGLTLHTYKTMDCGTYGWEECVIRKECTYQEEVENYYRESGQILCLFYLLQGVDLHHENLIARGAHPTVIDFETLFHLKLPQKYFTHSPFAEPTVLNVSLLPFYRIENGFVVDVSGLGKNCVFLNGTPCPANEYVETIIDGFSSLYTSISEKKNHFLTLITPLSNLKARFISRPTYLYGYLLQRLTIPELLLNPARVEEELEVLSTYLTEEGKCDLLPLIQEEKKSLLQGDIPFFSTQPSTKHLYYKNEILIENVFEKSALELVVERVRAMNENDLRLQTRLIRQSFVIRTKNLHPNKEILSAATPSLQPLEPSQMLDYVYKIAKSLKAKQLQFNDGRIGWIDLEPDATAEQYSLHPISDTLYSGKSGIALFFAALFNATQDPQWRDESLICTHDFTKKILAGYCDPLVTQMGIGGLSGAAGASYALLHIGRLIHCPNTLEAAITLALSITPKHIAADSLFDMIGGSAGLILSNLALYSYFPERQLIQTACLAADHLIENARKMDTGLGWGKNDETPLLGLSHGSAGIAYALFKLGSFTKNNTYTKLGEQALAYERSLFSPEKRNWPRLNTIPPAYSVRWCHGSTGIGLARLATLPFYRDPLIEQEIAWALQNTTDHLLEGGYATLCCTALGRIEFLSELARSQSNPELFLLAANALSTLIQAEGLEEHYPPGLMQGVAGTGYTLLRLLDKKGDLPQILILSR